MGKVQVYPWIMTRTHPVSDKLEIELRPDFRWYHFLPATGGEFRHPLDDIVVATVGVDMHDFYNPTPRVTVHPDYLRDYLAARKYALVIGIVADRFATLPEVTSLGLETMEQEKRIDDSTAIWTTIAQEASPPFARSSLYWSAVVLPYNRPRPERSAWHFFGKLPPDVSGPPPQFLIDAQGTRATAAAAGIRYLYFRREVLRKYLDTPGYRVYFHMRHWGCASTPLDKSVDAGVNTENLVTAFAPDIADLPVAEQAYWASFNCIPSGGVCAELYLTRMQLQPPHSPSLPELIQAAVSDLRDAFKDRFGSDLYRTKYNELPSYRHLSVGPVTENIQEFLDLAKTLYKIVIDDMDEKMLVAALPPDKRPGKGDHVKSIKLMELVLIALGHAEDDARIVTDTLRALTVLRNVEAHMLSPVDLEKEFAYWGASGIPPSRRGMWHVCVDSVTGAIHQIAQMLRRT